MKKKGFTLIELLIVVAIIAILAAIAVPNFLEAQVRSKVSRSKADVRSLATAAEAYNVDWNALPPTTNSWWGTLLDCTNLGDAEAYYSLLVPLSTPVAYITTAHLPDAFGNVNWQDAPYNGNFVYYFFNLDPNDCLVGSVYRGLAGPGWEEGSENDQILVSNRYAFISTGPDKITEFDREGGAVVDGAVAEANVVIQGLGLYDPTNGTTSVGDILRTGKGIIVDRGR